MKIRTERLLIRALTTGDLDAYHSIFGSPEVCRFDDFEPLSRDESRDHLRQLVRQYGGETKELEFAIERVEDHAVIGILSYLIKDGVLCIGYHIREDYHRQGYAMEAIVPYVAWLAENFTLPIGALVDTENTASRRVLEKLGFEFLREYPIRNDKGEDRLEREYRLPRKEQPSLLAAVAPGKYIGKRRDT